MKAKIHCPKHGLQESNNDTGFAVACIKCYPPKEEACEFCGGTGIVETTSSDGLILERKCHCKIHDGEDVEDDNS